MPIGTMIGSTTTIYNGNWKPLKYHSNGDVEKSEFSNLLPQSPPLRYKSIYGLRLRG
jgi:hypothetical protein